MNEAEEKKKYLVALQWLCGVTKKLKYLLAMFHDPREAWQVSGSSLGQLPGWQSKDVEAFMSKRKSLVIERYWERLQQEGINIILPEEEDYPLNLSYIYDPPRILYVKGNKTALKRESVAIVGARKASSYGKMAAEKLAADLAEQNITIVSGMARGIDTAAHRGALSAGITVAVLGCGLDIVYPSSNRNLMQEIAEQGAIVSEYPLGTIAQAWNFPVRNRIISGLSLGVVVVEAEEKSGSLITVDSALEQGRDVFAVPGSIFTANSKGPHKLIKQGAKLVTCAEDVIEELGLATLFPVALQLSNSRVNKLNADEQKVLELLACEPLPVDLLAEKSRQAPGELLAILTILEIKGLIKQLPGQYFLRLVP